MSRTPFISDIVTFTDNGKVVINGIGSPKVIELPSDVVEWLKSNKEARRILGGLVTHYKFRRRLCNRGALRSLILLLYSRLNKTPPYKIALKYRVSPEQLYRIERGLKKDGLIEFLINLSS